MKAFIHSELDATASPPSLHTLSSMEKQNALPWATPHREKRVSNSSRVDVDFFVPVGLLGENLDALSLLALLLFVLFNILYLTLVSNLLSSFETNRYRFPIDGFFLILFGMAVETVRRWWQRPRKTVYEQRAAP